MNGQVHARTFRNINSSATYFACNPNRRSIPWLLFLVFDDMAAPVTYFISFELRILIGMLRCVTFLAAVGVRALVAVLGIEVVVDGAVEFVRAVEPRTGAHEDAGGKPFRAVVAVRSASVGRRIIVAVRAIWCSCGFAGLSACRRGFCRQANARRNHQSNKNDEPLQGSSSTS